jgi:hypothetical protein
MSYGRAAKSFNSRSGSKPSIKRDDILSKNLSDRSEDENRMMKCKLCNESFKSA